MTSSAEDINDAVEDVTRRVRKIDCWLTLMVFSLKAAWKNQGRYHRVLLIFPCRELKAAHLSFSKCKLLQVYTTNSFGPLRLINAVLPQRRSRRQRVIANVAGIGVLQGAIGDGVFCSSKAAMTRATETLHAVTSPLGINVC